MSDREAQFVAYACFEAEEDSDRVTILGVASEMEDINAWKDERRSKGSTVEHDTDNEEKPNVESSEAGEAENSLNGGGFKRLMNNITSSISSYRHLIFFGQLAVPFMKHYFTNTKLYKRVNSEFTLVEEDKDFRTYGVTRDQFLWLESQIKQLREIERAGVAMPGAILLSLVATFDSAIADLLRLVLKLRPEKYNDSSKTITIKDLLSMSSFQEAVDKVIEDEVDAVMRDSHDRQVLSLEKIINTKIKENYDEYGRFIEIFERRNLVAHGNCVVNITYLRNCKEAGYDVSKLERGGVLQLNPKYLDRSADRLMEFALLATFVAWKKDFGKEIEQIYDTLTDITYHLIKEQRYRSATRILEFVLFKQDAKISDQIRKRMAINLANAQKKNKNHKRSEEILDSIDWSATSDIFKMCVASIKGNVQEVVKLLPKVAQQDADLKNYMREWPVFDWIRDDPDVRDEFKRIFGEQLVPASEDHREDVGAEGEGTLARHTLH